MSRTRSLLAIPSLAALFVLGLPALASGFPDVQQGYDLLAPSKQEPVAAAATEKSQPSKAKVEKPSAAAALPFMNQKAPDLPFLTRPSADLPFLKNPAPVADLPFLKQRQAVSVQKRVEPTIQHDPVIENGIFQEKLVDGIPIENDKISAELSAASRPRKPNLPRTEMGLLAPGSKDGFDGLGEAPSMYGGQLILPSTRLAPLGGADTGADAALSF